MNDSTENRIFAHECHSDSVYEEMFPYDENLGKRNLRRLTLINELIAAIFLSFVREENFSRRLRRWIGYGDLPFSQRVFFNAHPRFASSRFICSDAINDRRDTSLFKDGQSKVSSYCVIVCIINLARYCRQANLRAPSFSCHINFRNPANAVARLIGTSR